MQTALRHRQTKGAETDMLSPTPPRHTSTLVRREKAAPSNGCKPHPATAPAGRRALEQPGRVVYLRYVGSTVEILPPARRDPNNGRWLPGGRSPNAGGLSREKRELVDVARERSPAALDKIFAIMNDDTVPPAVQLAAAGMILNRAYGTPRPMIETGDRGAEGFMVRAPRGADAGASGGRPSGLTRDGGELLAAGA